MLQDYTNKSGTRYNVSWEGWLLSGLVIDNAGVVGLHDQDYFHNGNKLINPLDSPIRVIQLGCDVCCLKHVSQVYQKFMFDQHGLKLEDI